MISMLSAIVSVLWASMKKAVELPMPIVLRMMPMQEAHKGAEDRPPIIPANPAAGATARFP